MTQLEKYAETLRIIDETLRAARAEDPFANLRIMVLESYKVSAQLDLLQEQIKEQVTDSSGSLVVIQARQEVLEALKKHPALPELEQLKKW